MVKFGSSVLAVAAALVAVGAAAADRTPAARAPGGWGPDGYRPGPIDARPVAAAPRPSRPADRIDPTPAAMPARTTAGPADDRPAPRHRTVRHATPYRGWRVPAVFLGPDLLVTDAAAWGLSPAGPGRRWIRYHDDAVLIDGTGRVEDVRYAFDWGRGGVGAPGAGPQDAAYDDGYEDGYRDASERAGDAVAPDYGAGEAYRGSGVTVYRNGGPGNYPPGATVVVVQNPGTSSTTTTTVTDAAVQAPARRSRPVGKTLRRHGATSR